MHGVTRGPGSTVGGAGPLRCPPLQRVASMPSSMQAQAHSSAQGPPQRQEQQRVRRRSNTEVGDALHPRSFLQSYTATPAVSALHSRAASPAPSDAAADALSHHTPTQLLYIEAHHRTLGADGTVCGGAQLLFCCLCHCALKRHTAALDAHLQGRRHNERVKGVQRIRCTLTLKEGGSASTHASAPRRLQLGLVPVLNLPCLWKAVLLALRAEQQQAAVRSSLAYSSGHQHVTVPAAAATLANLQLHAPPELMHPSVLKLKYTDEHGQLRPLMRGPDLQQALQLLAEVNMINLVVTDWNGKIAQAAKRAAAQAHAQAQAQVASRDSASGKVATSRDKVEPPHPAPKHPTLVRELARQVPTPPPPTLRPLLRAPCATPATLLRLSSASSTAGSHSSASSSCGSSVRGHDSEEGSVSPPMQSSPETSVEEEGDSSSESPHQTAGVPPLLLESSSVAETTAPPAAAPATALCRFWNPNPADNKCNRTRCPFRHEPIESAPEPGRDGETVAGTVEHGEPAQNAQVGGDTVMAQPQRPSPCDVALSQPESIGSQAPAASSSDEWQVVPSRSKSNKPPRYAKGPPRPHTPYHVATAPSRWQPAREKTPRAAPPSARRYTSAQLLSWRSEDAPASLQPEQHAALLRCGILASASPLKPPLPLPAIAASASASAAPPVPLLPLVLRQRDASPSENFLLRQDGSPVLTPAPVAVRSASPAPLLQLHVSDSPLPPPGFCLLAPPPTSQPLLFAPIDPAPLSSLRALPLQQPLFVSAAAGRGHTHVQQEGGLGAQVHVQAQAVSYEQQRETCPPHRVEGRHADAAAHPTPMAEAEEEQQQATQEGRVGDALVFEPTDEQFHPAPPPCLSPDLPLSFSMLLPSPCVFPPFAFGMPRTVLAELMRI